MLVAFSSPIASWLQKQFLSIVANHSKSDFSTVNWLADSEEIRQVYSRNSLEDSNDHSGKFDWNWLSFSLIVQRPTGLSAISAPSYKEPNKVLTLTTSKNLTEFTYGDFSFHRKANRDKLCVD